MCNKISRRKFIGQSCAAMGGATMLSSIASLGVINTLAARPHIIGNTGDYKAMVCVLLAGGADSYNMLIPTESSEYADYVATRGPLALDKDADPAQVLDLNYSDNGRTFGVHSAMPGIQQMFNNNDLSFVSNVGSLVEPIINKAEYDAEIKKRPLGLYSHSDQSMQWQTSVADTRSAVGFAGRIADILNDMNTIPEISMNISLSGKNRFQSGTSGSEYSISNSTTDLNIGLDGFSSWWSNSGYLNLSKNNAIDSLAEQQYINAFEKTIGAQTKATSESNEIFKVAFQKLIPITTPFSDSRLSDDLKKIAEVISINQHLGANRQVFYVTLGGWDHHNDLIGSQNSLLPVLDNALTEFNAALTEIGMKDDVVTFTISDFARTLTTNGSGSDHAWGGNCMIMGGPVDGGKVKGDYPSLSLANELNLSDRGRLLPTTSVDEFYAELALWFGASPNDLEYVLPNLCNFYSTSGCPSPLPGGYMPIGLFA